MTSHELQRLLLRAALCEERDALAAWREFTGVGIAPAELDEGAVRLLPRVYVNLRDSGAVGSLRNIHRHTSLSNQVLFDRVGTALQELGRAGVPTLVLKGAAMCTRAGSDPGARPMADVDVLVPPAQTAAADDVLRDAGWRRSRADDHAIEVVMSTKHGVRFDGPQGAAIDLHWCPLHEPVDPEPFWAAARAAELGGAPTLALDPADELLVTCAHGLLGGRALRWVADAVVIVRAPGVDWGRLVAQAERCRLTARLHHALAQLDGQFGVAVPPGVLRLLAAAPRPVHERVTHRLLRVRPRRGLTTALYWDSHRRRRAIGAPGSDVPFAHWLREVIEAPRWRDLALRYRRAYHRRRAAD